MRINIKSKQLLIFFFSSMITTVMHAQSAVSSFVEYGASIHGGDHTPLWQASMQQGLSSIDNNTYVRGNVTYRYSLGNNWKINSALDLVSASGMTSHFIVQQAYLLVKRSAFELLLGSKESNSNLLDQNLTSGGLVWSGNARPIPQIKFGIPEFTPLTSNLFFKGEISFGWWTDGRYLSNLTAGTDAEYTKDIRYHHKSFYFRVGKPDAKFNFIFGMCLDDQFGGIRYDASNPTGLNLGNSLKYYLKALIPQHGDSKDGELIGEDIQYEGNLLGSEHLKLNYQNKSATIGLYLENYFDDFSGMGKLNGFDGLWGIEYHSKKRRVISGVVLEYYQTTNQSGPLHGVDNSAAKKTGGADDYYNNYLYQGWQHWGMTIANPLIASPIYFYDRINKYSNYDLGSPYNRVKAFHLGIDGNISESVAYRAKISYNKTWGTPFVPTVNILENFSAFTEMSYIPKRTPSWIFSASVAMDRGKIYGDNVGLQLKIKKRF